MKTERVGAIVMLIFSAALLTGCWDRRELEDLGYVSAIGIDKGRDNRMKITLQIGNPQVGTSLKANVKEPANDIITIPAADIVSAKELSNSVVSRTLTFTHTKAIIVSEKYAGSEEFYRHLEAVIREREMRADTNIIVCREDAAEFIRNNKPPMETRSTKFYTFMAERWRESGLVPFSTLIRFIQRTEDNTSSFLAILTTAKQPSEKLNVENETDYTAGQINLTADNNTQMIGSAVFREGKMIGKMTGFETKLTLMLRHKSQLKGVDLTFPDPLNPQYEVSARVAHLKKPNINMKLEGPKPRVDITVPLKLQILSIPSFEDYVTDLDKQRLLKNSIEAYMESRTMALIRKTQNEFKAEPFEWGLYSRRYFRTYKEFVKFDWLKSYPSMEVSVKYDIKIINLGKQLKPSNMKKIGD